MEQVFTNWDTLEHMSEHTLLQTIEPTRNFGTHLEHILDRIHNYQTLNMTLLNLFDLKKMLLL